SRLSLRSSVPVHAPGDPASVRLETTQFPVADPPARIVCVPSITHALTATPSEVNVVPAVTTKVPPPVTPAMLCDTPPSNTSVPAEIVVMPLQLAALVNV